MSQFLTAVFDGNVLLPDTPLALEPNRCYEITIEAAAQPVSKSNTWDVIEAMTGTVE